MSPKNSPSNAAGNYVEDTSIQESSSPAFLRRFAIGNLTIRQMLAELAGTFIFLSFGLGSIAQTVVSDGKFGDWLLIAICWGIGLALGVYASAGVSGGHLNPAVSLAMAVFGRLEWIKIPFYFAGQLLGAFLAAVLVYTMYYTSISTFNQATAGIFATYPQPQVSTGAAFYTELVATAFLVGGIFVVCDNMNQHPSKGAQPLVIGLVIAAITMAFGYNTGFALNPARDLGPRILTAMAPWGTSAFTYCNYYWWVPILAPFCGGIIGAGAYTLFVEMHHPPKEKQQLNIA